MQVLGRSPIEALFFDAMMAGKVFLDFFVSSCQFNTLGASATSTAQVSIASDSDFVIQQVNLAAFSAANTIIANPDMRILLVDAGSGRQFFDTSQHVSNVTGQNRDSGSEPFNLPMAKLIRWGSSISVTMTNSGGVAAIVDVAFVGFKVFYSPGVDRGDIVPIVG